MCVHELLKFGCLKPERPVFSNTHLSPHFDTLFHRTINFWVPQKILKKETWEKKKLKKFISSIQNKQARVLQGTWCTPSHVHNTFTPLTFPTVSWHFLYPLLLSSELLSVVIFSKSKSDLATFLLKYSRTFNGPQNKFQSP